MLIFSRHISPDVVKVYAYHDTKKPVDSVFLEQFDVVLTTYETACLDHLKGGVLQGAKWFRVALDEGTLKTLQFYLSNELVC